MVARARARGRSARGGASGRRGPQEEWRRGTGGGDKSEEWSGRSDDTSDAETEEDRMPA